MKKTFLVAGIFTALLWQSGHAMTPEQRREYRDKLVEILPKVPAFEEWLERTDELPPDFDSLPKINGLPDPLTMKYP